jgi:flagellum-specific ATP synthase
MLHALRRGIAALPAHRAVGRVAACSRASITVTGLGGQARIGDRLCLDQGKEALFAEAVAIGRDGVLALPEASPEGLTVGTAATLVGPSHIAPHEGWIGRIVDPFGRPLDGRPLAPGAAERPLTAAPPAPATRRALGRRLDTGLALFDTFLPIVRGQRIGLFAGSGVGKTTLLGRLARGVAADVAVLAFVGERGREVREFAERVLGPEGMARSVLVVSTSDQSALVRRRAALTAMTVAEHFRDAGRQVLLMVDSITRFAEAHREIALTSGEGASYRGHPPSMPAQVMALAERAGPGADRADTGDITAVFTVLVAASNMDEPVADVLRGTLDGHVVLDREIAERGRFPAVDVLRSVSRSLLQAVSPEEGALLARARALLAAHERSDLMVRAGLYQGGTDPVLDEAILRRDPLEAFLALTSAGGAGESFARLRDVLDGVETG